ncbi:MAG: isoprenylcysteine carboxylmethyltransferase family protein [Deltaproteobacteria bacterium]|nr:MAG: isoprenylcysteine carboxylmethyltransferase family protein [Deltaproteobacteria bacterium]
MFNKLYWFFSYLGLMVLAASFVMGFRYEAGAPVGNILFNLGLYAIYIAVHIVMTLPAFKRAVFGHVEGTPAERRIYVTISILTWVGVYAFHQPVPGFAVNAPQWVQFIGLCDFLLSVVAFFEFATFESLGSLLGMPGSELSHSVGAETPLMTEGPYASVRHPMYRAAFFYAFSSLLIHPNTGQLLFAVMVSASFLGFIPFEERQLIKARGEEYRDYMRRTPYRVFHDLW